MIIDISPVIHEGAPVWPGDVPFSLDPTWSIASGDTVSVATVRSTTHIGAHIDAPSHVIDGAPSVVDTPLESCIGACLVVDVSALCGATGSPRAAAEAVEVRKRVSEVLAQATGERDAVTGDVPIERLLLRHAAPDTAGGAVWDDDMPGIDPELLRWFGSQGGKLIGIDLASFDYATSTELTAHRVGLEHGLVLLEGLDLSGAPEGEAELVALPLPWRGADASPVRAILRLP